MHLKFCKHYSGCMAEKCHAGVIYDAVTPDPHLPGRALRLPCLREPLSKSAIAVSEFKRQGKCDRFEVATDQEIEAELTEHLLFMERADKAREAIMFRVKAGTWSGVTKCPNCRGDLHFSVARCNGHVHARCATPHCVNFRE